MDVETTKAYLAGLKLKHAQPSEEVIYARLDARIFCRPGNQNKNQSNT